MQDSIFNILFIDDDCSTYLPVLTPVAKNQGFTIYGLDNVREGLKLLGENPDAMDAVLLDIAFGQNEMQGLEALKEIKQMYPYLPVIMLTGSDQTTDLHKVVECMRNGAYDYVGKQHLDPDQLFKVLYEAIHKSRQQYRFEKIMTNNDSTGFFHIIKSVTHGCFHTQAVFGFELKSVSKAKNNSEEDLLKNSAIKWHNNLLRTIQIGYKDNLVINLKYIADKGKFNCYLVFSLSESDGHLLKTSLACLFQDLKSFFPTIQPDNIFPYRFEEITDKEFLQKTTEFSEDFVYYLFYRKPLIVKNIEKSVMGFTNPGENAHLQEQEKKQSYSLPYPAPMHYDFELLTALLNQDNYTEIDVQIKSRSLSIDETQTIRQVIKKPSIIIENLNNEKRKIYSDYLEKFVASGNDKFVVSVLLKQPQSYLNQSLSTHILNYFFGASQDVENSRRTSDNLFRYTIEADASGSQLPFTYSITNILQAFHLPLPECNYLPGISQQSPIFHMFPRNIPVDGITLGEKKNGKESLQIRINQDDLARHLYIMGQTGTGKTTLLKSMIKDCLNKNVGFAVFDPHGDLFNDLLHLLPTNKKHKLITLNTSDPKNSAKHNPLLYNKNNPQEKSLVINELFRIFNTLYNLRLVGGPMFELYFKNGMKLIMDDGVQEQFGPPKLSKFVDVFYNENVRRRRLRVCKDKTVVDFFDSAESTTGEISFNNIAHYIVSKVNRFTDDFYLSPIIMSQDNNIDFRQVIDEGKILLVKLDKGKIGADNTSLLGQLLLSSIVLAAMSRGELDVTRRKPFYLFIDEFQNFIKGDIASALSEVRKYGLSLILANQTLAQLRDRYESVSMVDSLLGNVGSMVFFRPGISDYEIVRHYFEPEFERSDILKLPNFKCIARLLIDNVPSEPFVFQTKL
ncbi:MAG: type IV secretion system DNA-binding domain-containing protein [Bacteroidales bacterium]|nr:type IV secretion system DNA-binding domain-containing protein [Acholeplasmataceae bacterium]MCK9447751.1 type IV secretion system DNA-binding domain-containing protein [Bacteroidales bacterium]